MRSTHPPLHAPLAAVVSVAAIALVLASSLVLGPSARTGPSGLAVLASGGNTTPDWKLLPAAHGPPARYGASEVWDPAINAVLLFGGGTIPVNGGVYVDNDTWIFQNGSWSNITSSLSASPPARVLAGMAYDPVDNYVVLFGGLTGGVGNPANNPPLNDTWVFQGMQWRPLSTPVAPSARDNPGMTWDAADGCILLFGGEVSYRAIYADDTWSFLGGVWTPVHPVPGPIPAPRSEAAMTYDPTDGYTVLFGGWNGSSRLGDTWTYVSGRWSRLVTPLAPSPRVNGNSGMAFDPQVNQAVLFGGENLTAFYSDTWGFAAGSWTDLTPLSAPGPEGRQGGALVFDPVAAGLLLFGGEPGWPVTLNDTWLFGTAPANSSDPPATTASHGMPILPMITGNAALAVVVGVGIGSAVVAGTVAVHLALRRSRRRP